MFLELAIVLLVGGGIFSYGFSKLATTTKFQVLGTMVNRVVTHERAIALTYDDGPNPPYTDQLLEVLERLQVQATFFAIGKNLEKYPQTALRIVASGHELGNHSYSHERMIGKSTSFIKSEIQQTDTLLKKLGVQSNSLFRSPYGVKRLRLPWVLANMSKKNILWNIDPQDYSADTSEAIVDHVVSQSQPGAIILLHDGGGDRSLTVAATEKIIEKLRAQGYQFKTVTQLLESSF